VPEAPAGAPGELNLAGPAGTRPGIVTAYMTGLSGMISFVLDGDAAAAAAVVD
jgi:cystathionine beta-lyase/cystathionine gamma-synthase